MNAKKVYVDLRSWLSSHRLESASPRGRGGWLFTIGEEIKCFCGTYTDARKQAVEYARASGHGVVVVMP